MLFTAHPIKTENIVYLVGRADVMATFFFMLTVRMYLCLKSGPGGRPLQRSSTSALVLFAVLILSAIGGLCKEPAFTTPLILIIVEVLLVPCSYVRVAVLAASFGVIYGVRSWFVSGTSVGFSYVDTPIQYQGALLTRTLSYLNVHAVYGQLLVLPWNQCWDYSYDAVPMVKTWDDMRLMQVLAAYLALVGLGHWGLCTWVKSGRRGAPGAAAAVIGVGTIIFMFLPASNLFFKVGTVVGERLLYPCTVGFAFVVAGVGQRASLVRRWRGMLFFFLMLALLVAYVTNSSIRTWHWSTKNILFKKDVDAWPRSVKTLHQWATVLQISDGALE